MKFLVTGVAGFIGSTIAERSLTNGHYVLGIDCFSDYYSKEIKLKNIEALMGNDKFRLISQDILETDLNNLLEETDVIYHQAAQAGVRASWGKDFNIYTQNNILVTQRLLEAAKGANLKKFIYASSSSVYGEVNKFPMLESDLPQPISPYGVSKLAAEHLCNLYHANFGIPTMSLRYFTVYGPKQRPDMAFHKFIKAIFEEETIIIYGDGDQTRDFTFISDAVNANMACLNCKNNGVVFNIGGGSRITVNKVIRVMEEIIGKKAVVKRIDVQKGDPKHTFADVTLAEQNLDYRPKVNIHQGLAAEVSYIKALYNF